MNQSIIRLRTLLFYLFFILIIAFVTILQYQDYYLNRNRNIKIEQNDNGFIRMNSRTLKTMFSCVEIQLQSQSQAKYFHCQKQKQKIKE